MTETSMALEEALYKRAHSCMNEWGQGGVPGLAHMLVTFAQREAALSSRAPQAKDDCRCQGCGKIYHVDFLVPDDVWAQISPRQIQGFKGGGLLCGKCIVERIEMQGEFGAFHVMPTPADEPKGESKP